MFNFNMSMVDDLERYLELYYQKIIHVDVADGSYSIVMMRDSEPKPPVGHIGDWFHQFVKTYVHPDDVDMFLENTTKEKMLDAMEGECIKFHYRRKAGHEWEDVIFMFIPDGNSDTTGYVFIKYAE